MIDRHAPESEYSLRQLDHTYLNALDEAALRTLSARLLDDLKEARDRPDNSSWPPSGRALVRTGSIPRTD